MNVCVYFSDSKETEEVMKQAKKLGETYGIAFSQLCFFALKNYMSDIKSGKIQLKGPKMLEPKP